MKTIHFTNSTDKRKLVILSIQDIREVINNYIDKFPVIIESNIVDKIIGLLFLDIVTNIEGFHPLMIEGETYSKIIDILTNCGFKQGQSLHILGFSEDIIIKYLLTNIPDLDMRDRAPNISFIDDSNILLTL